MAKKDRIPTNDLRDLQRVLELLSSYTADVLKQNPQEVLSTNFTSGIRGCELLYRTIEGIVGSAKSAPAWDLLEPLIAEWTSPKEVKQIVEQGESKVQATRKKRQKG